MKLINKSLLVSLLGRWIFQILFSLNKISIKGEKNLIELLKSGEPIMLCVWHGRLLFPSWYMRKHTSLHIISSRHFDSELLAHILRRWSYKLIRGSTNKGGTRVIRKMKKIFKEGGIVAVTNDGPKGPARIAKSGSISLDIKNNVNIITVTGSATKYWQMKSWDRFILPKPFGKIHIVISNPLNTTIKPSSSEKEIQMLTEFMNYYQDKVDNLTGKIP